MAFWLIRQKPKANPSRLLELGGRCHRKKNFEMELQFSFSKEHRKNFLKSFFDWVFLEIGRNIEGHKKLGNEKMVSNCWVEIYATGRYVVPFHFHKQGVGIKYFTKGKKMARGNFLKKDSWVE